MAEYQIGATELRQRLTDVIQRVREEKATYVVETFGRPQVVIIGIEEYERLQVFRRIALQDKVELARAAFGMWADRNDIDDTWLARSRSQWRSDWSEEEARNE
jgi:prevent-host-death family protein